MTNSYLKLTVLTSFHLTDIRHPEELSLLKKPRDPTKKKKKKLDDQSEDDALELEGPLIMPGSGETQTQQRQNVKLLYPVSSVKGVDS